MNMRKMLHLVAMSAVLFWSTGECAITILNEVTSCHVRVAIASPCLPGYRELYNKEPAPRVEEFVDVRGCASNFASFRVPSLGTSTTVEIEDGAYVMLQDDPAHGHISGYLLDNTQAVMSTLFTL